MDAAEAGGRIPFDFHARPVHCDARSDEYACPAECDARSDGYAAPDIHARPADCDARFDRDDADEGRECLHACGAADAHGCADGYTAPDCDARPSERDARPTDKPAPTATAEPAAMPVMESSVEGDGMNGMVMPIAAVAAIAAAGGFFGFAYKRRRNGDGNGVE